jgi:hypothetical protein
MVAARAGAAVSRIDAIETTRRIDSRYHVRKANDERQNDRKAGASAGIVSKRKACSYPQSENSDAPAQQKLQHET